MKKKNINSLIKNFIFVVLIFLLISSVFSLFFQPFEKKEIVSITQLVEDIEQEKVKKITVAGSELSILYQDETKAISRKETETALSQSLINYGVSLEKLKKVEVETKQEGGAWAGLAPFLLLFLPLLFFGFFFWMIFRQAKTGAMQAFNFSKAKAKLFGAKGASKEKITFKDVAGLKKPKKS